MALKVFHTADVHVGLKFRSRDYADDTRKALVAARIEVVQRMVSMANERGCQLFVVAGDLFDHIGVAKRDAVAVAKALDRFEGVVAVLPGNHDYARVDDDRLWNAFRDAMGDCALLLSRSEPYDLREDGLDAALYPGPCAAKHSTTNAVDWISPAAKLSDVRFHLGVAHGSLDGHSPDFNKDYFPMSEEALLTAGMDVWLLGHTHLRYPNVDSGSDARVFFPSTPEPDGFDCDHGGHAWVITLELDGAVSYESCPTGVFRFRELDAELKSDADIDLLRARFGELDPKEDLVKLELAGRLPRETYEARHALVDDLRQHTLYLEADLSELRRDVSQKEIDDEFTNGSFPHRLLSKLAADPGDALALQLAYELVQEVRS